MEYTDEQRLEKIQSTTEKLLTYLLLSEIWKNAANPGVLLLPAKLGKIARSRGVRPLVGFGGERAPVALMCEPTEPTGETRWFDSSQARQNPQELNSWRFFSTKF